MAAEFQREFVAEDACRHRQHREQEADDQRRWNAGGGISDNDECPECHQPGAHAVQLEAMRAVTEHKAHGGPVLENGSEIEQASLCGPWLHRSQEEARRVAQQLVERSLAACVNVLGPIESIYRWQEKLESAGEFLLLIKTTAAQFCAVRDAVRQLHSYELPECVSVAIDDGSEKYLAWLHDNVKK